MSYLKGKDIKQQGDCLCYCYTRKIQIFLTGNKLDSAHAIGARKFKVQEYNKPEGFEKF